MKLYLLTLLLGYTLFSHAQSEKTFYTTRNGAVDGYDVVAYFTLEKPTEGKKEFSYEWQGVTWRFANANHLNLFKKNPAQYIPEFGGHCAYGVSRGYKVEIDPQAWDIYNGKLYLNYDLDVQATWKKDKAGYIEKANKNWAKIKND